MISIVAANNNRADTVLAHFLTAVCRYGCPSQVRGDRGGENKKVSVFMIISRGSHWGSFIWGSYVYSHYLNISRGL